MKLTEFHQSCPQCGGPAFSDLILAEKKDACYHKVKATAKVWPSAYASGRLVQCRKKGAANYGNSKKNESQEQESIAEEQLDEKCWDGYQQQGMKNKGGRQVPNCVPLESMEKDLMKENQDELARILELGGVKLNEELIQEFDLIESIILNLAERNGVDAEMIWEDLDSLSHDELYVFAVTSEPVMEDWQKANKKDRTAGMSQKAVNAYRRENPGSKLKTAVTTKPSKLKRGSKASKRRKSYCSRSRGQMKMHNISCAKTPDKAICKARRRWNC